MEKFYKLPVTVLPPTGWKLLQDITLHYSHPEPGDLLAKLPANWLPGASGLPYSNLPRCELKIKLRSRGLA